jgi:hypothetical protein
MTSYERAAITIACLEISLRADAGPSGISNGKSQISKF